MEDLRLLWEQRGAKSIKYSKRPRKDLVSGKLKLPEERIDNIKERFYDLSEVLELFYKLYVQKYELYGDAILAFIGNDLFRNWPWKDFPFTSKKAKELFVKGGIDTDIVGLMDADIEQKKELKEINKHIVYEHWTPISFFRDTFVIAREKGVELSKSDFYKLLIDNYRTVRITKDENKLLDKKNKANRTKDTYDELNIEIFEKELWDNFLM